LAGETNARNVFASETRVSQRFANRKARGAPPVFGMLLGPANLRGGEWLMLFRGGRNKLPAAIDDNGARAARANVNPK
jgi:hypothetical protein